LAAIKTVLSLMGILGIGLIHRAVNKSLFERLSIGKAQNIWIFLPNFYLFWK
jgi:hypothetical protein